MKMKKPQLILSYGNKGFIFTLDIAIATFLVIAFLAAGGYYISKGTEPLPRLQMVRTGYDIIAVLDYSGALDSLDRDIINNELIEMLPPNYEMRLEINGTHPSSIIIETSSIPEGKKFVAAGKRFFVSGNYYETAKFYIWLK